MSISFFEYNKCSTCRSAAKWLAARGVDVVARPIVDEPPTVAELRSMWTRSGLPLAKFFNTSGQSYRALDRDRLARASDDERLAMLAADGKLVKRPLLDDGARVLVGFSEEAYAAWAEAGAVTPGSPAKGR
jgi:arsenate reductase